VAQRLPVAIRFGPQPAQDTEIQAKSCLPFQSRNFIRAKIPLIFNLLSKINGKKFEDSLHGTEARPTFAASLKKGVF